jgi:putative DNA methylase
MDDKRLIEDFIPVKEISAESSHEKSLRHGHISTIHLWWARRPLVACRAAVYASLVTADFHAPANGNSKNRASLARANAAKFMTSLCKYPGNPKIIEEARQNILKAHNQRTGEDGAPPKVLDCFSGGGAIPLEALRLGCESHALELNPVAYLILLCTLVYPQKYGKPNLTSRWKGLAEEVEKWGSWVLENIKKEVGDLYPRIPYPEAAPVALEKQKQSEFKSHEFKRKQPELTMPGGYLTPIAYLWTRTIRCSSRGCNATVPLVRQTWLSKKAGRYIALTITPGKDGSLQFEVVRSSHRTEAAAIGAFGFNPSEFGKAGNAACQHCGTVADSDYVKQESQAGRMSRELMSVVCIHTGRQGKIYLTANELPNVALPLETSIAKRMQKLCVETGLTPPDEPMDTNDPTTVAGRGFGITKWSELFTPRQLLSMLSFVKWVRRAHEEMLKAGYNDDCAKAVIAYCAMSLDKLAQLNCSLSRWKLDAEAVVDLFGRQAIPMVWDFAENVPISGLGGSWQSQMERTIGGLSSIPNITVATSQLRRGSATELPFDNESFDAVITDPPYYDNVSYAVLSDFFYVWLKRSVGHLYPEHFSAELTPKRSEIIADSCRQGSKDKARHFYEEMMQKSLAEMHRVLKPEGVLTLVYAHKSVSGWEVLVEALRATGFVVQEAWPLHTEMGSRLIAMDASALSSSIFITARKEGQKQVGEYNEVRRELESIVRERVDTLWGEGIGGADLLIACVGAGLKAYTHYARIELPNGDHIPALRFLGEVEGMVQEVLMEKLFHTRAAISTIDAPTQFYVLWRYFYGKSDLEAGDAIIFAYPLHVELDGAQGLSGGHTSLLAKKGGKYRLIDFTERGVDDDLGLKMHFGLGQVPLIDVLHRLLWLMEHRTALIDDFITRSMPDVERLRLVAGVLAGSGLQGGLRLTTDAETGALQKLITNWDSLVEGGGSLFRQRR